MKTIYTDEMKVEAVRLWKSGQFTTRRRLAEHLARMWDRRVPVQTLGGWILDAGRAADLDKDGPAYALRRAREGITAAHIMGECRRRRTPITFKDAERAVVEARISGTRLYLLRGTVPWAETDTGYKIILRSSNFGRYILRIDRFDEIVGRVFAQDKTGALLGIAGVIGDFHLYEKGVYQLLRVTDRGIVSTAPADRRTAA